MERKRSITYLEYSDRDLSRAQAMFAREDYDACCIYCHPTMEKRMKHYITMFGLPEDTKHLSTHKLSYLYSKRLVI